MPFLKNLTLSLIAANFLVTEVGAETPKQAQKIEAAAATTEHAKVGSAAPNFTLNDSNGVVHTLAQHKGSLVVLEWFNSGCPFVLKHYEAGNMQKLQKDYTAKDVVWLSVVSSAPGKQGSGTPAEHNAKIAEWKSVPSAFLIDENGKVGSAYGARTTPHMFVINKEGVLVYAGAIDDKPSTKGSDIATSKNYVTTALDELISGKSVTTASTEPYGCSIKYAAGNASKM